MRRLIYHNFQDELARLYSVLEKHLEGREWLVGPHYSLADIKALWVSSILFIETALTVLWVQALVSDRIAL